METNDQNQSNGMHRAILGRKHTNYILKIVLFFRVLYGNLTNDVEDGVKNEISKLLNVLKCDSESYITMDLSKFYV